MLDGRTRLMIAALLIVVFALAAILVRMTNSPPPPDASIDRSEIQTAAIQAFIAEMTASALPSKPPHTQTAFPTGIAPTAVSGTPGCLGLRFVRDVTVPDNTEMTPAQVFTKSWQVENTGTCLWKPGFQVVLLGGVAMGGSPFKVAQTVGPGGSIQVSIKMVAPTNQTGVVQGTWNMADENGVPFGDYLSVVIVVEGRAKSTITPTAGRTP